MLFPVRLSVKGFWILLHLLILATEDIRERQVSMFVILELGLTGAVYAVWTGREPVLLPGMLLLLFSRFSKEQIGYGDSWLVLALGMWMEGPKLLFMLWAGLALGTASAVCLKKKELPLVPFLAAAYVLGEWI